MPECLGKKLFINEEKKNLQACGKHVYGQEMWIFKSRRKKKLKLFVIAKSAYLCLLGSCPTAQMLEHDVRGPWSYSTEFEK